MIDSFRGEYEFLSNFYRTPVEFDGVLYPSSEHAYQAQKTLDGEIRAGIAHLRSAGTAKRFGTDDIEARPDWKQIRVGVMRSILAVKFAVGSALAQKLLDTGDEELVEGNWWHDTFWGVYKGRGENWLGRLLMERREYLAHQRPDSQT